MLESRVWMLKMFDFLANKFLWQGAPTDFRRADVTLGTDCEGRPVLVEQAREDAQAMFNASKKTDSSEKEVVS